METKNKKKWAASYRAQAIQLMQQSREIAQYAWELDPPRFAISGTGVAIDFMPELAMPACKQPDECGCDAIEEKARTEMSGDSPPTGEYWQMQTIMEYTVPRDDTGKQLYEPHWEGELPVGETYAMGSLTLKLRNNHFGHDYAWGDWTRFPGMEDPVVKDAFVCYTCNRAYVGTFTGNVS